MKILWVWQNADVNPGTAIAHALEQMGHTVRVCTNPDPLFNYDTGDYKLTMPRFDIPVWPQQLAAFQAADGERGGAAGYLIPWEWLAEKWGEMEKGVPDFTLIWEGGLTVGGPKPEGWEGMPVFYWACDNGRGADAEMRAAHIAGVSHMLILCKWYFDYFEIKRHVASEIAPGLWHSGRAFDSRNTYWMPVCADPRMFRRFPEEEKRYDVLFMGTTGLKWADDRNKDGVLCPSTVGPDGRYELPAGEPSPQDPKYNEWRERGELVKLLLKETAFQFHYRPPKHGEEYARELARARIVWNCQGGFHCTHYGTTNRPFQAALVGSIPMTNYSDEIDDLFISDEEILTYKISFCPWHHLFEWMDYALMRDKILSVLADPQWQKQLAEATYAKSFEKHLPIHRAQRLVDIVEHREVDRYRV